MKSHVPVQASDVKTGHEKSSAANLAKATFVNNRPDALIQQEMQYLATNNQRSAVQQKAFHEAFGGIDNGIPQGQDASRRKPQIQSKNGAFIDAGTPVIQRVVWEKGNPDWKPILQQDKHGNHNLPGANTPVGTFFNDVTGFQTKSLYAVSEDASKVNRELPPGATIDTFLDKAHIFYTQPDPLPDGTIPLPSIYFKAFGGLIRVRLEEERKLPQASFHEKRTLKTRKGKNDNRPPEELEDYQPYKKYVLAGNFPASAAADAKDPEYTNRRMVDYTSAKKPHPGTAVQSNMELPDGLTLETIKNMLRLFFQGPLSEYKGEKKVAIAGSKKRAEIVAAVKKNAGFVEQALKNQG